FPRLSVGLGRHRRGHSVASGSILLSDRSRYLSGTHLRFAFDYPLKGSHRFLIAYPSGFCYFSKDLRTNFYVELDLDRKILGSGFSADGRTGIIGPEYNQRGYRLLDHLYLPYQRREWAVVPAGNGALHHLFGEHIGYRIHSGTGFLPAVHGKPQPDYHRAPSFLLQLYGQFGSRRIQRDPHCFR